MSNKKTPITPDAARRIQSHADRTGTNQDFKSRAQSAADKQGGGASSASTTPKTQGKK